MIVQFTKGFMNYAAKVFGSPIEEVEEHAAERLEKCYKCNHLDNKLHKCNQCGCFLAIKTRCLTCNCPLGEWTQVE